MNYEYLEMLLVPTLVMYREGLEAFLLITLMMKITEQNNSQHKYIIGGIGIGILSSIFLAVALHKFALNYEGIVNWLGLVTALTMFYVAFYNRKVSQHIKEHLSSIKDFTPMAFLLAVSTVFVREGAEVVLMLWSMLNNDLETTLYGLGLGLVLLAVSYKLVKFGLDRIGTAFLFRYSSLIFVALGVYYLYETLEAFFG